MLVILCVFYVNASHFVCVFYVNSSHSVCECHGEKIITTQVPIFVNAGNFVNILEKELLQTKYPYVLGHICKCWSFHLVKSWGNNYCNLSTHICKCWSFCECQGERIITT